MPVYTAPSYIRDRGASGRRTHRTRPRLAPSPEPAAAGLPSATRWLVGEVRRQPAFGRVDRLSLALRVVGDLIFANPADGEVACVPARQVQPADTRRGRHRGMFGQADADLLRAQQIKQLELFAVIGTRRIAERRSNASMAFRDHILWRRRVVDP